MTVILCVRVLLLNEVIGLVNVCPLSQNKYHVNASEYSAAWFVKLYLDAVSVCHVITTSTLMLLCIQCIAQW